MSGSSASSPTSESTPRPLLPLISSSTRGLSPLQANSPQPSTGLTHKEWIIPPRPKPGRKPATDTPPTKRKAQNRAAQRAFRERRAAKVEELEEQMKEMEEEDEREQNQLREKIYRLEGKVQEYERVVVKYGERMKSLEQELAEERRARARLQRESMGTRGTSISVGTVPLSPRKRISETETPSHHPHSNAVPLGCGYCTANTRCECFERAVDVANLTVEASEPISKRPHSPSQSEHSKRLRHSEVAEIKPEDDNEIDFTTYRPSQSSTAAVPLQQPATVSRSSDDCGFCQDGTACLCAELDQDAHKANVGGSRLAHLLSQPSDNSKYTSAPISLLVGENTNPCRNGPGSCSQCQSSPISTLFCKSLAATRCTASTASGSLSLLPPMSTAPCGNLNGCCRTLSPPLPRSSSTPSYNLPQVQPPSPPFAVPVTGPTLSCADTFTTLSRHPAFEQATAELGVWMPQLTTVPKGVEGRTAFEIEAASVMGVLKLFDRRFGRES